MCYADSSSMEEHRLSALTAGDVLPPNSYTEVALLSQHAAIAGP